MPTVSTGPDAYQDLDRIRQRVDYDGASLFPDNEQLRFDELLVELEEESRGIFETLWGDETPLTETGRTDTIRPTDDAALALVYPIQDIQQVERKITVSSDWDTLDTEFYTFTEHRLILAERPNVNTLRHRQRGNTLAQNAQRATWGDIAAELRVTYDRGFGDTPPQDIQSVQIQLINNMLRQLRTEQTIAAGSPEEVASMTESSAVVTEEVRSRIDDVTKPGLATISV